MDEDGYPTEETLERIATWPLTDTAGLFQFLQSIWRWPSYIFRMDPVPEMGKTVNQWHVSTGGWSGHEAIIQAMQRNEALWHVCWVQSRRGGHYIFEEY